MRHACNDCTTVHAPTSQRGRPAHTRAQAPQRLQARCDAQLQAEQAGARLRPAGGLLTPRLRRYRSTPRIATHAAVGTRQAGRHPRPARRCGAHLGRGGLCHRLWLFSACGRAERTDTCSHNGPSQPMKAKEAARPGLAQAVCLVMSCSLLHALPATGWRRRLRHGHERRHDERG